jgi:hypothetical protein
MLLNVELTIQYWCYERESMEEINFSHSEVPSDVRRDQNIGGVPVLRELEGDMCANCGSLRYVLVFRTNGNSQSGTLAARCSACHEPKELTPSDIEQECRPELRNH